MISYDLITILHEGEKLDETKKGVADVLTRCGAEIASEEEWGARKLHHPVKNTTNGFFVYRSLRVDPAKVKEISHDLSLMSGMIRFMVHRVKSGK